MAYLHHNIYPHPQVLNLLEYFDQKYVNGRKCQLAQTASKVSSQIMERTSCHTNNDCESLNNVYFHIVGHHHTSMWKSIDTLKKQYAKDELVIAQTLVQMQTRIQTCAWSIMLVQKSLISSSKVLLGTSLFYNENSLALIPTFQLFCNYDIFVFYSLQNVTCSVVFFVPILFHSIPI